MLSGDLLELGELFRRPALEVASCAEKPDFSRPYTNKSQQDVDTTTTSPERLATGIGTSTEI